MTSLFGIFASPSFSPLCEHMNIVLKSAEALEDFFEHIIAENWEKAELTQQSINELENKADQMKEEIRLHMPKSLLLSVERTDILDILTLQDRIANRAKHLSGIVLTRHMALPQEIQEDFKNFLIHAIDTVRCLNDITAELQTLFKANFRQKEATKIEALIHNLDTIEDKTDDLEILLRHKVFKLENDLPPIEVMFLYKTLDWISDLADRSQRCGHRFLLLIAQ